MTPARWHAIAKFSASIPRTLRLSPEPAKLLFAPVTTSPRNTTLAEAVKANPQDANSRQLLETTDLILRTNPFHSHISDAERNRRITAAFSQADKRLTECAQQKGVDLKDTAASSPLSALQFRWTSARPSLAHLRSPGETDLPDALMDVVFQIERQTATICGSPQGLDLALLLISQKREAATQ